MDSHLTDAGLCELIRMHVVSITGYPQDPSHYCDPQTAYSTWMSETASYFQIPVGMQCDPLIFLDTCEVLAQHDHKYRVHKSSGKPYTLLEAFCIAVPSPHGIFVAGTNFSLPVTDPMYVTMANMTNIGSRTDST
ncbi:Bodo-specific multi-copy gene family, putative [Bodo saltans]|uniref:Bodo-specific multi-copy gene family, putative n=1 Tax=Bodo saltans TaxID=75058 RepID=A0A0S4JSY2_BODSA|nr:Bodo-specific multi-copy gene family, putative [Bodo saltans]|eukprot:CUG93690.1 Bodo-specific multi-copy gene family, putative [Bodo saltans]